MKQLLGCSLFGLGLLLASFCFLLAYLGYKLTEEE